GVPGAAGGALGPLARDERGAGGRRDGRVHDREALHRRQDAARLAGSPSLRRPSRDEVDARGHSHGREGARQADQGRRAAGAGCVLVRAPQRDLEDRHREGHARDARDAHVQAPRHRDQPALLRGRDRPRRERGHPGRHDAHVGDVVKDGLRVVAVVPARGGTDRIPYLNIKRLGDRPLLAHTLDAARAASSVDRVVVSTDDDAVAEVAKGCGAEVPFVRPRELAEEINSLMPVVQHALREIERQGDRPDLVVLLQATTPFRDARAIDAAVARLVEGGFDSVVSVTEDRTLAWKDERGLLVPLFAEAGPREKQPPIYKENGAVVALRRAAVDAPTRFGARVGYLVLDKRSGLTVHDLDDFWMAERLLRQPRILFRADGGRRIGMGHVYRSLAIADALVQASQA